MAEDIPAQVEPETKEDLPDGEIRLTVKVNCEDPCEFVEEHGVKSVVLEKLWEKFMRHPHPEGVSWVNHLCSADLFTALNTQIDVLKGKERVDFHPNTGDVVRDIVHPSLYCLAREPTAEWGTIVKPAADGAAALEAKDMWGRAYEASRYQWLPAEVVVSATGQCTFESYVNNLSRETYGDLYKSLEVLLSRTLPHFEAVWGYGKDLTFHDGDDEMDYDSDAGIEWKSSCVSLKGRRLQVIVKIADYDLPPAGEHEGVWHVEGMSHENIVAAAVHVLRKEPGLAGGELAFKRAFRKDEAVKIFSSVPQCRPKHAEELIEQGLVPLGKVPMPEGRTVVFPNSHVHRLSKITNTSGEPQSRRIVVFWLVNPERKITSTADIPPQQGSMPLDEALQNRLKLMEERKRHKQDWNVREISLCEH